ncbi:MAG: type II toxin-antitoxin system VapC family toxin [Rhodocyclaceae bacterium]|nr:type II toxin-antitoxin system VapC family toxin [Rhodocyclaceae bacterium]
MIALLDTHSFLWAIATPEKLSAKVRKIIVDPTHEIHISTISFWEISLKFALGKLDLVGCMPEDLIVVAQDMGLGITSPTPNESATFHHLPKRAHKDPFDRMLIWQCLQRQWAFISKDDALSDYEALGLTTLW